MVAGLGSAAASVHRDIFKALRHGVMDRVMAVRRAAAACLGQMLPHAPFLATSELENVFSLCFRALDGADYEARMAVAAVLGALVAATQQPDRGRARAASLDEVLALLAAGFLRGGLGFLKTGGEMIKGSVVSRETRVSQAFIAFLNFSLPLIPIINFYSKI